MSAEDKAKLDSLNFAVFNVSLVTGQNYVDVPISGITANSFAMASRNRHTAASGCYVTKTSVPETGTLRLWFQSEATANTNSYFSIIYAI